LTARLIPPHMARAGLWKEGSAGGAGGTTRQPTTAYGRLLLERGLLPSAPGGDGAAVARAECASSYPSITAHLLQGFHLPGLDVGGDIQAAAAAEGGEVEGEGALKEKEKRRRRKVGFVYHRGATGGAAEGMRRDPEPRHGSCAVVGSSHVLLGAARGGEIDSYDAVIRFDDAPTRGFENVLGRRTTYRVASPAFVAAVAAGAPSAVRIVAGLPRLVTGAKAMVVGEETLRQQQRDIQEKIPALLLYAVSRGTTNKVKALYTAFATRMAALVEGTATPAADHAGRKQDSSAAATWVEEAIAEDVPVTLMGVFFAMHTCGEVHVFGFPPPGAERHQHDAHEDYYSTYGGGGKIGASIGGSGGVWGVRSGGSGGKGGGSNKEAHVKGPGGRGAPGVGIGDEVTRLILRVLALEGYIHNHP